jgi:isopentenyl-diphosphate delta-isomerase
MVCRNLEVPVVAKEVGSGISAEVALRLAGAGVRAIDIAGKGGTSWYAVEASRAAKAGQPVNVAFAEWGIPTDEALVAVRKALPEMPLVASGGIRSGLDIAKAIALGGDMAALGQPLLAPALDSSGMVVKSLRAIIYELKVAMLCVGARDLDALRRTPLFRRPL